jgi:hypothetical protein
MLARYLNQSLLRIFGVHIDVSLREAVQDIVEQRASVGGVRVAK